MVVSPADYLIDRHPEKLGKIFRIWLDIPSLPDIKISEIPVS
jgi:hypothetical protein